MNQAECYGLLELKEGASIAEIKSSYRRLARKYHPDVNPGDAQAQAKFIAITEAYQFLLEAIKNQDVHQASSTQTAPKTSPKTSSESSSAPKSSTPPKTTVTKKQPKATGRLSEVEKQLKSQSYQQLQSMLKEQRFARAVVLVEGLAERIPHDLEVKQWQAIAYQRWGRYLVSAGQTEKARIYLKKALRTDPHNRALWAEVERDFQRIEYNIL
ncbi:MAG: DnaJ domain-containing protein [Coleofasciculaceae cyanobacterium SM2_1_6]|nr:DnaJ domain-containing protein [Coleofasciculaceae cyanobacterium SM2_1_6]